MADQPPVSGHSWYLKYCTWGEVSAMGGLKCSVCMRLGVKRQQAGCVCQQEASISWGCLN